MKTAFVLASLLQSPYLSYFRLCLLIFFFMIPLSFSFTRLDALIFLFLSLNSSRCKHENPRIPMMTADIFISFLWKQSRKDVIQWRKARNKHLNCLE